MKKISMLVIIFLSIANYAQAMTKDEASLAFIKAGAAYQTADFDAAIKQYESIIKSGFESSSIYYNLGNAYFKKQRLGEAILNYERAYHLNPRDPDIQANLSYATSMVTSYGEPSSASLLQWIMPHLDLVTQTEVTWITIILFMFLGFLILATLFLTWPRTQKIISLALCLSVLIFHIIALGLKTNQIHHQAIILMDAKARFEPMDDATVHFQLGEGMSVKLLTRQYGWSKIQRHDGRIGWIKDSTFEAI